MHVLVTGVGGFIGPRLVSRLVAHGERVTATYLDVAPEIPDVTLEAVNLLDLDRLKAVFAAAAPHVVIHLAGLSHVGESWHRLPEYFEANILGTENVLEAANGRPVVFASSAEVYGAVPEDEQPIDEQRPLRPGTPYALTKAAAERMILRGGGVVVRCFNLVGPGQSPRFALPAFALQLAAIRDGRQEPVLRVGNLGARRDFVHVDDACDAFVLLARRGERGTTYNVASGNACTVAEALDELRAISGVAAEVKVDPERLRPLDLPLLRGDASRLRGLGWAPRRSLHDALVDLWDDVLRGGTA